MPETNDDFVKNFLQGGGNSPIKSNVTSDTTSKFTDDLNKVSSGVGYDSLTDEQGLMTFAMISAYIALHGSTEDKKAFSAQMNNFVERFPPLEKYMERVFLLAMVCKIQHGSESMLDIFPLLTTVDPSVLDDPESKTDIIQEYVKRTIVSQN